MPADTLDFEEPVAVLLKEVEALRLMPQTPERVASIRRLEQRADEIRGEIYAHLKPGSVLVKPNDLVMRGQPIAAVGSSGSSTEPHLHFQVCDAPDPLLCAGIPARFEDVEIYGTLQERQLQSGDLVRNKKK